MQAVSIQTKQPESLEAARDRAVTRARETLSDPVVLSWLDDRIHRAAPEIPGAVTETRWIEYGESRGGRLKVDVGDAYHFIVGEAKDFLEPHSLFTNITDEEGNTYLCVTGACTEADRRRISEGFGSGGGKGA
jgi:hypothetical protein